MSSSSWSRGAGEAPVGEAQTQTAAAAKLPKGKAAAKPANPKSRLEVSGKVLAGTQVQVGGKPVSVDAQGYFRTEFPYQKDILNLEITDKAGASRSFTYDLKELVLT
jgi:hypothetical protein